VRRGQAGLTERFIIYAKQRRAEMRRRKLAFRSAAGLALVMFAASCVHDAQQISFASTPPQGVADALLTLTTLPVDPTDLEPLSEEQAVAANAAIPVSRHFDTGAAPMLAQAATALDQLRSLDCLAQAVYYEARSETEDGQRAVAQVVLNRVRHPSYPASVCGVVYQGPLKKGGGCQFTFTCDGSLGVRPLGAAWDRARRIASEALAGAVFAPIGHATNYHTTSVFPRWAPNLIKAALIGSHIFYRIPGPGGEAGAFNRAYAGHEPMPVASRILFAKAAPATPSPVDRAGPVLQYRGPAAAPTNVAALPYDQLPQIMSSDRLPESRVKAAYANAGTWRVAPGEKASAAE
jgi:spore germination cell wall hydrolase CwlJ-like protein